MDPEEPCLPMEREREIDGQLCRSRRIPKFEASKCWRSKTRRGAEASKLGDGKAAFEPLGTPREAGGTSCSPSRQRSPASDGCHHLWEAMAVGSPGMTG